MSDKKNKVDHDKLFFELHHQGADEYALKWVRLNDMATRAIYDNAPDFDIAMPINAHVVSLVVKTMMDFYQDEQKQISEMNCWGCKEGARQRELLEKKENAVELEGHIESKKSKGGKTLGYRWVKPKKNLGYVDSGVVCARVGCDYTMKKLCANCHRCEGTHWAGHCAPRNKLPDPCRPKNPQRRKKHG